MPFPETRTSFGYTEAELLTMTPGQFTVEDDVVVGFPVANRPRLEVQELLPLCIPDAHHAIGKREGKRPHQHAAHDS